MLAVGRLVEKKGFDVLVDAAAALGADALQVRILGDGPLRGALDERIAATGAPVELLGSAPPAQVLAAMGEADVLAMPCVVAADGDRDSMPVVVKEAMAMGLLVVASDEVGLPECVLAPWGFLAAPGDPPTRSPTRCARRSRSVPSERAAAGEAARAWVREHADVDRETAPHGGRDRARRQGAGGMSTRSRVLSAIVRQPASSAHALLARGLRRFEAAPDDEQVVATRAAARPGSAPRVG